MCLEGGAQGAGWGIRENTKRGLYLFWGRLIQIPTDVPSRTRETYTPPLKYELELKKQIEVEHIWQQTEKAWLELEGYCLSLSKDGKGSSDGQGPQSLRPFDVNNLCLLSQLMKETWRRFPKPGTGLTQTALSCCSAS